MKPGQKLCLLLVQEVVEQGTDGLGSVGERPSSERSAEPPVGGQQQGDHHPCRDVGDVVMSVMSAVAGARQPVIRFYLPQGRELSEGRFSSVALWSRKRKSPRAEGQLLG